jgi:hypothetical protein
MPRSTLRLPSQTTGARRRAGSDALERWKSISSIASAIAIPFVLAIVGYFIQKQLADEGLKKDYVSIAAGILKENPASQESELRRWAVAVLDLNSPIPFSSKAKDELEKRIFLGVAPARIPGPPDVCMKPARAARVQPLVHRLSKQRIDGVAVVVKQYDELLQVALKAEEEAMEDRVSLECLQRYGRLVSTWVEETQAMYAKPLSESAASAVSK